jgi:hypothetical protein
MNYNFQLFLQTLAGAAQVTFTSDSAQWVLPDTIPVPQLLVLVGCFPDGVKIRMADGSERAVEEFVGNSNEEIRSESGTKTVTAITWGNEDHPLVFLRDSRGHQLLLTEGHPVMTTHGAVAAADLREGEVVRTESGNAKLIEVSRRASPKPVPIHNLRVGTDMAAQRNSGGR